jgi:hypothetical protein
MRRRAHDAPLFFSRTYDYLERYLPTQAGRSQRTAEGMAGNAHTQGRLDGGEPFQIGQTEGFQLVHAESHFFQLRQGYSLGLEIGDAGSAAHIAAMFGTRHRDSIFRQTGVISDFAQMSIILNCGTSRGEVQKRQKKDPAGSAGS